jgi:CheY-like chemotaxis protein
VKRKLLLADDSVTIQRVVELTFSGEGIDVVAVSDGEQAIARIPAEKPDIVLADIAMPKKTGYDVAAFVKEHPTLSHVPVLLLAGAFEPVDEERALRVKSDGVLVKPFETHEVVARVRELIGSGGASSRPQPVTPATAPPAAGDEILEWTDPSRSDESLDEYFDRLDAAFTKRSPTPAPAAPEPQDAEAGDMSLPTFDSLLNNVTQMTPAEHPRPFPHLAPPQSRDAAAQHPPQATADDDETDGNLLADLFHLLLEVEQGDRDAASIRTPPEIDRIRKRNTIE